MSGPRVRIITMSPKRIFIDIKAFIRTLVQMFKHTQITGTSVQTHTNHGLRISSWAKPTAGRQSVAMLL